MRYFLKGLKFMFFGIIFVAVLGGVTMLLWNWLMPALFGLAHISFLQAIGILVLSKILFGGFGPRGGAHWRGHHWKQHWQERMEKMSPEEREKWRGKMKHHWGAFPFEQKTETNETDENKQP